MAIAVTNGPCQHEGCKRLAVRSDRFCFDHLDPDELEAANNDATEDEELEDRIHRLEERTDVRQEEEPMPKAFELRHECGFKTTRAQAYAMHAKHCDGTGTPRSGRIAERERALVPAPRGKGASARSRPAPLLHAPKLIDRTPPAANGVRAIQGAATDKAVEIVIAGLMAKRDAIDRAIAALQAVS
jgi:hypothetical protein